MWLRQMELNHPLPGQSRTYFRCTMPQYGAGHGSRTRMRSPSPGLKPGVSSDSTNPANGIRSRNRTCDLMLVRHALSQLSYADVNGGSCRTRTCDPPVNGRTLYQLG